MSAARDIDLRPTDRGSSPQALARTGRSHGLRKTCTWIVRHKAMALAGAIVLLYLWLGIFAPVLAPSDPLTGESSGRLSPPSQAHLLGTDELGRDILSRIMFGASTSLLIQAGAVVTSLVVGGALGLIAGYASGWLDEAVMRLMDIFLAFPGVFLSIAVIAVLGPGVMSVTWAVGIALIPSFARLMRSSAMTCSELEYVQAARGIGAGPFRILLRHVLPNSLPPMIVYTTLVLAYVLLTASGLSYLGLGVQPPDPEWGAMLSNSRTYLLTAPHATVIPGLAIMIVSLAFNILGDGLRDTLDPRMRSGI